MNSTTTILIVDDNQTNLAVLIKYLHDTGHEIMIARNGTQALEQMEYQQPDLVLLDVMMPDMDGFEVCRRLKQNEATHNIPVIFMTALGDLHSKIQGFQAGGVDYIMKPYQQQEVLARVKTQLELRALTQQLTESNHELENRVQERTMDLQAAYEATIEGWARALELRDQETRGHSERVVQLSVELARRLGIPETEIPHIRRGAMLHDIGKIAIPDSVLFKPATLDSNEWTIMRQHPVFAYQLLQGIDYLRPAIDIPWCHHEHWDGGGYPRGLAGKDIPLAARLFTVVDVWDALSNERPYHKPWPAPAIVQHLKDSSGTLFDPEVVVVFIELLEDFKLI